MKIGFLKALRLSAQYQKMDLPQQQAIRDLRLRRIVDFARENSPYYAQLYRDLPADWKLSDLPPVNKRELMARFNDWPTDRSIRLEDINVFMQNLDNVGRKFRGHWLIFTTSGSTGCPLVALCDSTTNNVMGAVNTMRSFARSEDLKAFFLRGGKSIGVFATGGFYLSNSSIRARLLAMPWKKRQMAITSALLPIPEIVAQLNAFQPALLGGYPSHLELLIDEQTSGRLNIHPVIIMTGGEQLSGDLQARLSAAFGCYVQTSYSCTEGGTIACQCREGHFHINEDWTVVEPVDANNQSVADGTRSDKILLTNLFNYTQPFIRYEVTDRVVRHSEPCPCGNPAPYLTLEGRTDDVLNLRANSASSTIVKIAPLSVYAVLKEVHGIRRFQLLAHPENQLELRLEPADGHSRAEGFALASEALKQYFSAQGVADVTITLASEAPCQHETSGKFKHVINLDT